MERQILFKSEMVQAILNTRPGVWPAEPIDLDKPFKWQTRRIVKAATNGECPYGHPGNYLWVRETWSCIGAEHIKPSEIAPGYTVQYKADSYFKNWRVEKWRPSIFMPRWASRLNLEIKSVRVERLQAITEADVIAEGAARRWPGPGPGPGPEPYQRNLVGVYVILWDYINARRGYSWNTNPYVWVIEFMRIN